MSDHSVQQVAVRRFTNSARYAAPLPLDQLTDGYLIQRQPLLADGRGTSHWCTPARELIRKVGRRATRRREGNQRTLFRQWDPTHTWPRGNYRVRITEYMRSLDGTRQTPPRTGYQSSHGDVALAAVENSAPASAQRAYVRSASDRSNALSAQLSTELTNAMRSGRT